MNNEYIKKIAEALQQMDEKKKLDPVGKADADIDNDGDVDSSDEYLHKRRKAIKKAMKEGEDDITPDKDGMKPCPECDGSMENHDPDCPRAKSSDKKKLEDDKDLDAKSAGKAMKHDCATHVTSEQWGYGECISGQHTLEEQEDGTAIVTHYDVMFEHGIEENVAVEDLTILREKSHLHAAKKKMKESKQPNQSGTKKERMLDKFKGKGAQDMAKDNNLDNPKHAEITPEEEGHQDAVKAGKVTKQAPPRSGDQRKGDLKVVNPVKGAPQ
jgi:hypothetical protein